MSTKTKASPNGAEATTGAAEAITLSPLRQETLEVPILGVTPLIPHRWSEKAKRMMLQAQQGKARQKKEPKDPAQEAADATYWLPDGRPGMPATAFKAAIAGAARHFEGVTMTMLKECVFVIGEGAEQLVAVEGEITMREDTPRNASGVADLRYRNQIWPWSTTLTIEFLKSQLTSEAVVALVDAAGFGGVGDWRPSAPKSKTGTFGRFHVGGDS
jgi:hypothetical protein